MDSPLIGPNSSPARLAKIDGRCREAKFMRQVRSELIAALGGADRVAIGQHMLVGLIATKALRLAMMTERMLAGGEIAFEMDRRFGWYSNSLRRDLMALGLDRTPEVAPPSLSEYLRGDTA
jgi:hypothetical protein